MAQKKEKQLVIGIEPAFFDLVRRVDKGNTAQYVRDLIVTDLASRGLITEKVFKEIYGLHESATTV